MEAKTATRRSGRAGFIAGLSIAVVLVGAGAYLGVAVSSAPLAPAVESSFSSYVEGLSATGKIVVVEAGERLEIRRTTPGLLFGDTTVGRLLGVRSDATVEASAWADLSFIIDLNATEAWSVRYDPAEGGRLSVAAPPIAMLTPAIHTDTISIVTTDRSVFLDERLLEARAMRDLTARFVEAASAMLDEPELREKAAAAIEDIARSFSRTAGFPLASVDVSFAPAED